jgi:hypothetical protein
MTISLSVEPVFWGPISVGTVEVIQLIRKYFNRSLIEAKTCVDRCVFDGEVSLLTGTSEAEVAFIQAISELVSPVHIDVSAVEPSR